jgi:heptosyltransferase-2
MQKTKFLFIQTAFIGDAILATALLEKTHQQFPKAEIDLIVRKGNEGLFKEHPFINRLIIWDKKGGKYKNLFRILRFVRKQEYNYIINLQRFASTGLFTAFSKAQQKIGFKKNPFSFLFNKKVAHEIGNGKHEVERNQQLIAHLTDNEPAPLRLYPNKKTFETVQQYKSENYITISPASVWYTKQFPREKWVEFIKSLEPTIKIYFLGGMSDMEICNQIKQECPKAKIEILAGKLNFLESLALMKNAVMNYTNDSAPLHLASAIDAPCTAIFCSTIPDFGFGPLSSKSKVVEIREKLNCRPCGLHGKKVCPEGHLKCGYSINIEDLKYI